MRKKTIRTLNEKMNVFECCLIRLNLDKHNFLKLYTTFGIYIGFYSNDVIIELAYISLEAPLCHSQVEKITKIGRSLLFPQHSVKSYRSTREFPKRPSTNEDNRIVKLSWSGE